MFVYGSLGVGEAAIGEKISKKHTRSSSTVGAQYSHQEIIASKTVFRM